MAREQTTKPKGRTGGRWGGPKFAARRKVCTFCANKGTRIDYKDVSLLGRYLTDRAKIMARRRTGTCARHQRALATAIKQARYLALLPYAAEHIYEMGTTYEVSRPYYRREATRPFAPATAPVEAKAQEADAEPTAAQTPVAEAAAAEAQPVEAATEPAVETVVEAAPEATAETEEEKA